jgi:hypothetical protein
MIRTTLAPPVHTATIADAQWVTQTADKAGPDGGEPVDVAGVACPAEVQRQLRTADVPAEQAKALVDLLVDEVLEHRSVALTAPLEGIAEPEALRRVDGSSVFTVAGADLYTSQRVLDAEQRLTTAAGCPDGAAVGESAVDVALLEIAANGTALDAGQAHLVRQLCTSGARLQLAIARAGAGKTAAIRA